MRMAQGRTVDAIHNSIATLVQGISYHPTKALTPGSSALARIVILLCQ
jgi:hypothetical protein